MVLTLNGAKRTTPIESILDIKYDTTLIANLNIFSHKNGNRKSSCS